MDKQSEAIKKSILFKNDNYKRTYFLHFGISSFSLLFFSIIIAQSITTDSTEERFRIFIKEQESKALAETFRGITANGKITPGLYKIERTGVSTKPVQKAARAFLTSLKQNQNATTLFTADDDQWRRWHNSTLYARQSISFKVMDEKQKAAALSLLRCSLSAKGLKLSFDIRHLNHTLGEITSNYTRFNEDNYWITLMGIPSDSKPWGWQIQGHHLVINYFVLGDQVVMTPTFMGAEPVTALSGKYVGTVVFQDEQNKGLSLIKALTERQQAKTILSFSKTENNNLTEAFTDNIVLDYAGICVSEFEKNQRVQLIDLIAQYVYNMDIGHAKVKMDEVRKYMDSTYFAWIGKTEPGSVFYYRIQSPVIIIEFDHQVLRTTSKPGQAGYLQPTQNHIHTMVRTPNGNDYGKDLLRQHYIEHPHIN